MRKSILAVSALLGAGALMLAGCAQAPGTGGSSTAPSSAGSSASSSASGSASNFKACMVSDSGGFDDKSFNQTSYKGLTDAKTQFGIQTGQVESKDAADMIAKAANRKAAVEDFAWLVLNSKEFLFNH